MAAERPLVARVDQATDVRTFPHGRVDVIEIGPLVLGRARLEPGWRWSRDVRPVVGAHSCQVRHVGYIVEGTLAIRMDDGTNEFAGPGDAFVVPPGHDGWVVGDGPCIMLDWAGGGEYGKPGARP